VCNTPHAGKACHPSDRKSWLHRPLVKQRYQWISRPRCSRLQNAACNSHAHIPEPAHNLPHAGFQRVYDQARVSSGQRFRTVVSLSWYILVIRSSRFCFPVTLFFIKSPNRFPHPLTLFVSFSVMRYALPVTGTVSANDALE